MMFKKVLLSSSVFFGLLFFVMAEECFADASAYFEQAKSYYEAGEYGKARELYQYVLDNWPEDANYAIWSQTLVALSNIDLGKPEAAQTAIDKLLAEFSGHEHIAEVVHHIAFHCLTSKKYEKARELYQYVLDHWPDDDSCAIWSQTGVAMSSISLGDTEAADAAGAKLLNKFSDNRHIAEEVHHLAWHCRYIAGNHTRALQYYQHVLDHWPEDDKYAIWSQSGLALSNIDLGNTEAAQAAIDKLLANFSGNEHLPEEVHHIAYHYRTLKEHEKAKQFYQYILDHWPGDDKYAIWSQSGVALSYIDLGNTEAADAAIERLLTQFSTYPGLPIAVSGIAEQYYNKAIQAENEGLANQARDHFQKAIAIYKILADELPSTFDLTPEACCLVGGCYRKLGQYQKSIQYYQKVVDDYPSYHLAWNALFLVGLNYESLKESGLISESEANPNIKAAYKQVLEQYPDCKAAKAARHWLSRHN